MLISEINMFMATRIIIILTTTYLMIVDLELLLDSFWFPLE